MNAQNVTFITRLPDETDKNKPSAKRQVRIPPGINNMNAFFRKLLGQPSRENSAPASLSSRGPHSSIQGGSESSIRAQLVQVVMRDLLRKSGIPPEWLVCQPQVINSRSRGQGIFVRLSVKHWDDRLMQYAFAFQKALLTDIVRFEPQAAKWLHGIAWQLEVAASCPHTELPDKAFWLSAPMPAPAPRQSLVAPVDAVAPTSPIVPQSAMPRLASAVSPTAFSTTVTMAPPAKPPVPQFALEKSKVEDDALKDLERFFAVRDRELAGHSANESPRAGFESTEPSPLARH